MSKKININVNVADKVASVIGAPTIVCGNSNYTITFTLDAEWETSNAKTARFVFRRDGEVKHIDVAFSGRVVGVPELANIDEVYVGLYAGELYTSTPARIICKKSIKCGAQKHEAPAPDVYQQILQTINNLDTLPTVSAVDAGRALMVNEDGRWVVRLPNFIYDQNSGDLMTFFIGTVEEWETWTGDKAKCIFFPTDLNLLDEVEAAFAQLESGEFEVGKAKQATKADGATQFFPPMRAEVQLGFVGGVSNLAKNKLTENGVYLIVLFIDAIGVVASGCIYTTGGSTNAERWAVGNYFIDWYPSYASNNISIYKQGTDVGGITISYEGSIYFYKIGEVGGGA